jgi:hypothetical protein
MTLMYLMLGRVVIGVSDPATALVPQQLQRPSRLPDVSTLPAPKFAHHLLSRLQTSPKTVHMIKS